MAKEKDTHEGNEVHTTRHYVRVVAFVVLSASVLGFLMYTVYPYLRHTPIEVVEEVGETSTTSEEVVGLPRALPTHIRIPKIHVDTDFERSLGLNADKTIEVPESYEKVGWYKYGAAPGEVGTASILGHVDSYQGAAVFYLLGKLEAGDRVYITRADGIEAEFVVEYSERYPQSDFPTEKVYGKTDYPSLRLITCTGTYDRGVARYTHNLVVYARLVEDTEGAGE